MDISRTDLLNMIDQDLLNQCRCESFRASGPGGQHRNTTDSAVRLTLKETKISALASSSRSQHKNRAEALKKLRFKIALKMRDKNAASLVGPRQVGKNDRRYPHFIAHILDALTMASYGVGDAAKILQISTGRLIRILANDPHVWKYVNEKRSQHKLRPLKS